MTACRYIPEKGIKVFFLLKRNFGYDSAWAALQRAMESDFKNKYKNTLSLDAEGVPSYNSMINKPEIRKVLSDTAIIESINKEFSPMEDTIENFNALMEQALNFNNTSEYRDNYIVNIEYIDDKIVLRAKPKNLDNSNAFSKQYAALKLNLRLAEIFEPIGITLGTLSSKEVSAGRVGITDFNNAIDSAKGFDSLIRIANNMEGALAISEEFSHMIIGVFRNEPLVKRALEQLVLNTLSIREILGDEFDDTMYFQEEDLYKVAEEALGKLLQKNLLEQFTPKSSKTPLFKRMINFIVNKFKSFKTTAVEDAVSSANEAMNSLSKSILNGTKQITREDIKNSRRNARFNALSDRINRNIEILKEAARVEVKRYKITKDKSNRDAAQSLVDNLLQYTNEDADTVLGLLNYSKHALTTLRGLSAAFHTINIMTPDLKFKFLRYTKSYLQSYGGFIEAMDKAIREESYEADNLFVDLEVDGLTVNMKDIINELASLSRELSIGFNEVATSSFTEFLKPFLGESIVIPIGDRKGETISVENLIKEAHSDISFMDRWLDSMAESSDVLLQLFDLAVKNAKDLARMDTIDYVKRIQALRIKAESMGITSFDWMYEKDNDGNKSGNYISAINHALFQKELNEMLKDLEERYGKNPTGLAAKDKLAEKNAWLSANAITIFGTPMPDPRIDKWKNKDFEGLSSNQLEIYDEFLALKEEFDKKLPTNRVELLKAVQRRKSGSERFLESVGSPSTIFDNIKGEIAETFLDRADDDILFGTSSKGLTDFSGKEFLTLPVIYTNRLENPNEISDDVFGSLMAYAYMACNYEQMDKIIDPLEVGRTLVSENRKVRKTRGNNIVTEKFEALGVSVTNKANLPDGSQIMQKLDDFFDCQIYHKYLKDEGTMDVLGNKVNTNKLVSFILKMSSTAQLGFNWLANMANVGTGVAMQNIEAAGNEFFGPSELFAADKIYLSEMGSFAAELGSRNKTSKLALFDELFNVKQDYNKRMQENQRKNWLQRIFGENIAFLGQEAGDHWLYNRTAIAMAKRQKVIVPDKGEMSLWDALLIVDVGTKGKVKKMVLPEGTTDTEGNKFSVTKFSRKIAHVNQHLFGIYNDEDANAANRVAIGRLLMQYRKWMKPQFNKRFLGAQKNLTTGDFEEGYYRTLGRMINELARGKVQLSAQWDNMTDHQKSNVRRALTEIIQFFAVWMIANLVEWPDDEDRPWAMKMAEYASRRLEHELGGLMPLHMGFIEENWKTLKTPMASMSAIDSLLDLCSSAITPSHWTTELQSGPYKGMTKLEKSLYKAPIPIISHYRQIDRFLDDIDTSISYYVRSY